MNIGKRLLIIIPAYNEEKSINNTLENIKLMCPDCDCLVVNDGSSDNTEEICYANEVNIVSLPINLGLNAAFRTEMKYADIMGYDYAIQIDGDGQHRGEYISEMLDYAKDNNLDILIGSRYKRKGAENSFRRTGSKLISLCVYLTTWKLLSDVTSGMRLYNRYMIELFSRNNNFYPEPDTIAYLLRCGAKVDEYPVEMNQRLHGHSYLTPLKSIQYMFDTCISVVVMQWFRKRRSIR